MAFRPPAVARGDTPPSPLFRNKPSAYHVSAHAAVSVTGYVTPHRGRGVILFRIVIRSVFTRRSDRGGRREIPENIRICIDRALAKDGKNFLSGYLERSLLEKSKHAGRHSTFGVLRGGRSYAIACNEIERRTNIKMKSGSYRNSERTVRSGPRTKRVLERATLITTPRDERPRRRLRASPATAAARLGQRRLMLILI
ncbi:hypothetical protein EVAR_33202_1 [Eumeta japonica]|uniref:Uncharacterized protein n=1 Tax=Eumeta variegata TaxID=151549 RepID=A0A4C1W4U2_EUMVA|nr:hypothetical protein EVAR_33202_1 [Eumeta japonica]